MAFPFFLDESFQALKIEENNENFIDSSNNCMKGRKKFDFEGKTEKCTEKIKELSNLLNQLRQDKKSFFQNTIINFKKIDDSNGIDKYENRY